MTRIGGVLLIAVGLTACATHKPPPEPVGPYHAINGAEQARMTPPDGRFKRPCDNPFNNAAHLCAEKP